MRWLLSRLDFDEEAPIVEHLEELRSRLFIMLGTLAIATVVAFVFHSRIIDWLGGPLPPDRKHIVTFGVAEPFTVSLSVSIYAALLFSLPVILWQLWLFFVPAVDRTVRRRILRLCAFATILGAGGLAFGYWVLLPRAVHFLTHYNEDKFNILIRAKDYFSFTSTVLLGIVAVFELPLVVLGLVSLGILSSRTLRRNRRIGYFVVAVIALGLPGPDPVTTALELLPMWALFEGSIWLAIYAERRQRRLVRVPDAAGT